MELIYGVFVEFDENNRPSDECLKLARQICPDIPEEYIYGDQLGQYLIDNNKNSALQIKYLYEDTYDFVIGILVAEISGLGEVGTFDEAIEIYHSADVKFILKEEFEKCEIYDYSASYYWCET